MDLALGLRNSLRSVALPIVPTMVPGLPGQYALPLVDLAKLVEVESVITASLVSIAWVTNSKA